MLGDLIRDVDAFYASLRRGRAVNVNDQSSQDRAIELATRYFKQFRQVVVRVAAESELRLHDELWQQLIRLAHGRNARRTYLKTLAVIRRQLSSFSASAVTILAGEEEEHSLDREPSREETLILKTLGALVPAAAASYQQGLIDLADATRVSYRGTAADFRESLRETLDHLAPDEDVEAQEWYKLEEGQKGPTMKQKTRFILTSRGQNKTQMAAAEKTVGLIEELTGEVMRAVYNRASLATHIHQSKAEVQRIKRYADTVFFDLLAIAT